MADVAGVTWDELSRGVRDALAWARAAEIDATDVGTRGLLIGMLRSGEDPANALLRHFRLVDEDVFAALQRQVADKRLDPHTPERPHLSDIPGLTANARRCLERAAELREAGRLPDVDVACLLTALLQTPSATARAAIADRLPDVSIQQLADVTLQWLRGNDMTYPQTLAAHFPSERKPAVKSAPARPARAPDKPWPFLAVLQRRVTTADGDEVRSAALGFLTSDRALATAPQAAPQATTLLLANREQGFSPLATVEHIAVLALAPPVPANIVPPLAAAYDGMDCFIATVDDHLPDVSIVAGVVRDDEDGASSEHFVVELKRGLSDTRLTMGSPVVNADGSIVGMVGPTATNRSVDAIGVNVILALPDDAKFGSVPAAPPVATGTLSGAGNDRVGDVDQLGFQTYVDAFADLITSPNTKPPLTIGIFGSWGMGKSFLLEHIEREVCARQPKVGSVDRPRVHVVHFNAWEYSATEVAWPGLVRKIVRKLDQDVPWPRRKRLWTRVRRNLPRESKRLRVQGVSLLLVLGTALVAAAVGGDARLSNGVLGAVAGALGVGGLLTLKAAAPMAGWITALFAGSDYGRQIGYMEEIRHDIETLEERLHERDDPEARVTDRILVLIDDLDRCEPAKAVEVLQALNLLLNFESFIVVLGIDARIITGAVEKHYEGLLGRAGASGYEYLDKIVQIPFRIPTPGRNDIIAFMGSQLGDPPESEQETKKPVPAEQHDAETGPPPAADDATPAPDGERLVDAVQRMDGAAEAKDAPPPPPEVPFTYDELLAFKLFADLLRPNPRHLKRLVNVYRLVRALARAQDEQLVLRRPKATIRWLVMWSQWPYASLAMVDRYEALLDEHGDKLAEKVAVDDPLLHLLDVTKAGLDEEKQRRLDDDHDDLRRLLLIPGCGLSWDEIRRIRRFTVNFNPAVEEQVREPAPATTSAPTG
jgi:hypothetical protein